MCFTIFVGMQQMIPGSESPKSCRFNESGSISSSMQIQEDVGDGLILTVYSLLSFGDCGGPDEGSNQVETSKASFGKGAQKLPSARAAGRPPKAMEF